MIKIFLLACLLIPLALSAQRIKKNEVNGFTDERTIETSIVTLKQGFSTGFGVEFTAVNKIYYLSLIGYGRNNSVVANDDRLQFIFNNGAIVKFNSRVELPSGDGAVPNLYIHHYYIKLSDIEMIRNNTIVIVRVMSPDGSANDIPVVKKNAKELSKLSEIFIKEVNK
jgi:hypothetical protein